MNLSEERIIWGDVETNGTDDHKDDILLEAAFLVTDGNLNILDETGYQAVVLYTPEQVKDIKASTNPFVIDMHEKTGLWERLPEGKPLAQIDEEAIAYIKQFVPKAKSARFAGNSITLDRNFLRKSLPATFEHIHYRSFDVSTVAGLAAMWGGEKLVYPKKTLHSAFSDITESIEELRFHRQNSFKF